MSLTIPTGVYGCSLAPPVLFPFAGRFVEIDGARLHYVERCGHFLWEDVPADSIRALRELLAADEPA